MPLVPPWCKGSTSDFGSDGPGSNPGGGAAGLPGKPTLTAQPGPRPGCRVEDADRGYGPLHDYTVEIREASATSLTDVSDAWLVGRSRELNAIGQHSDTDAQRVTIRDADELLAEARHRGEPWVVAQLLRNCASMRLSTPEFTRSADRLLDELLAHTRRHGLVVLEADAQALRGHRELLAGSEDRALSEIASGLAILDEERKPDPSLGQRSWERLLATALNDIGLVLTQLGIYEKADEVMSRAHHRIRASGGPHEIAVHMINRCRMLLGWALRLERSGQDAVATDRFATASAIGVAVEGPWRESLFPRLSDRPAADQLPVLGAAHALARPSVEHITRLENLRSLDHAMHPREKIIVAIGLARCLARANRAQEAMGVLARTRTELDGDASEPTLRISLVREYAQLAERQGTDTGAALHDYVLELEGELSAMRQTRIATLTTRLDHARLSRVHGAISRQALQDPLTGLPNRRALDDRLESLRDRPESMALSVALVDLDGFKGVNDRCSHAEGDEVLRVIANTLRNALRGDDLVARYGGDEFVVLLPGATLVAAEAALKRAVEAVEQLPEALSRGVTLSIGAVSMRHEESSSQVLARADAAMYQAKRQGGSRVIALVSDPPPAHSVAARFDGAGFDGRER